MFNDCMYLCVQVFHAGHLLLLLNWFVTWNIFNGSCDHCQYPVSVRVNIGSRAEQSIDTMSKAKPTNVPAMKKAQPYKDWKKQLLIWQLEVLWHSSLIKMACSSHIVWISCRSIAISIDLEKFRERLFYHNNRKSQWVIIEKQKL